MDQALFLILTIQVAIQFLSPQLRMDVVRHRVVREFQYCFLELTILILRQLQVQIHF